MSLCNLLIDVCVNKHTLRQLFVHEVRPGDLSLLWRRGGQGSLSLLSNQRFMDVRDNTSPSNGCLDQSVQLFISSNRELKKNVIIMIFHLLVKETPKQ